jgi:hypothetical protein
MVTAKAVSSVTATNNVTTAPDGTTTSASVEANGVSTVFIRTSANFGAVNFSLYLKYDSQQFVQIIQSADAACFVNFDIQNGVIGNAGAKTTNVQIENVGSGWYRCSAYLNASGAGTLRVYHVSSLSAGFGGSSTTIGNTYFTWGWQAEDGDIATDYIATTSAAVSVGPVSGLPRLDYLNSSCPRLLLEPQRTNVYLNSENFATSDSISGSAITSNVETSPDGYLNADKIQGDGSASSFQVFNNITIAASTIYTFSVFAKAGNTNFVQLSCTNMDTDTNAVFDVSLGTITLTGASSSPTITNYGNGWYRCSIQMVAQTTDLSGRFRVYVPENGSGGAWAGSDSNGKNLFLYGRQLEAGAYATSYIPTLGTSVTRVADAASKTGITSLIGQTEGTLFVDATLTNVIDTVNLRGLIELNDGTTNNRFSIYRGANTTDVTALVFTTSTTKSATLSSTGRTKIAIGYDASGISFYFNGTLVATETPITYPACSELDLGIISNNTNRILGDGINQALLFKTRLTNAQLAELTTL